MQGLGQIRRKGKRGVLEPPPLLLTPRCSHMHSRLLQPAFIRIRKQSRTASVSSHKRSGMTQYLYLENTPGRRSGQAQTLKVHPHSPEPGVSSSLQGRVQHTRRRGWREWAEDLSGL